MSFLPTQKYAEVIEVLPILCVDVILRNSRGQYLLVKRANEPKKGHWWVIGGRVLKGESLEQASLRKIKQETGLEVKRVKPIGYFESIADTNPLDLPFYYHAVSVVFTTIFDDQQQIKLDDQSMEWKFAEELPVDFLIKPFNQLID